MSRTRQISISKSLGVVLVSVLCAAIGHTQEGRGFRFWDASTGRLVKDLTGILDAPLVASPNGKWLASGGNDRRVCLRATADSGGAPRYTLAGHADVGM